MEIELTEFERNTKAIEAMGWKIKNLSQTGENPTLQVKDIDLSKNEVAFYFSAFNNKDSDNDVIKPGAFKKTFSEQKGRIKYLYNHNTTQSPGVIKSLEEDSHGAFAVATFYERPEPIGPAVREMYSKGGITEHSMGFRAVREGYDKLADANIISEIKLWEVSALTAWGANMNTPMIGVKGFKSKLMDLLTKKDLTEEQFNQVETLIKSFEKKEVAPFDYSKLVNDLNF